MPVNPATLPDIQDAGPEYGLLRTILFFALYAALIVGALAYLRWKLTGVEDDFSSAPDDDGPDP